MKCKTLCAIAAVLALSGCSLFQDEESISNDNNPATEKSVTTTAKDSNNDSKQNEDAPTKEDGKNTTDTDESDSSNVNSNMQENVKSEKSGNESKTAISNNSAEANKVQTNQKPASQQNTSNSSSNSAKSNSSSKDTSANTPAKSAPSSNTASNKTDSETYTVAEVMSNPEKYMDMGTISVVGRIAQGIIGETSDGTPIGPLWDLNSSDADPTYIALTGKEVAGQATDTMVCTGKVIHAHGIYMLDVESYHVQ